MEELGISAKEVQYLVDEHYFFGMGANEIKRHLYDKHYIKSTQFIPSVSDEAVLQVRRFNEGGAYPSYLREKPDFTPINEISTDDPNTFLHSRSDRNELTLRERFLSGEELGASGFAELVYSTVGPTYIDRFMNGLNVLFNGPEYSASSYEFVYEFIDGIKDDPSLNGFQSAKHLSLMRNDKWVEFMFRMISPWLSKSAMKSTNIQLDSQTSQMLLEANSDNKIKLPKLNDELFFIDIKQEVPEQRYISAIACEPTYSETTGKYELAISFIVEWKSIAFESISTIIIKEEHLDNLDEHIACVGPLSNVDVRDIEVLGYKTIVENVISLVAAAWNLNANNKTQTIIQELPKSTDKLFASMSKKKNKIKKRFKEASFFKFNAIHSSGQPKGKGASWSLNHLITVNGHYRLQPCGKGNKDTKLIWIDKYEKGVGSEIRPGTGHSMAKIKGDQYWG